MMIDTHAHLDDPTLLAELDGVLARARAAGVDRVIAVATDAESSAQVVALAEERAEVFAAAGIHPNHASLALAGDWERVESIAARPRVVAIGETGLDRYRDHAPFSLQQEFFDRHLALARRLDLPIVIHCRNCEQELIEQLERLKRPVRGVLHSFTGNWEHAEAFLRLGLDLSFAGMITFANKSLDPLRSVAARVPIDRLLTETDSPYLSPHPFRGARNEPARVALVVERLATLRGLSVEELARAASENARALFRLPDRT